MVRHQVMVENTDAVAAALIGQHIEIGRAARVGEEYVLPVVAALNSVMRQTGDYYTGVFRHGRSMRERRQIENILATVLGLLNDPAVLKTQRKN